jgi:hypothetical protein
MGKEFYKTLQGQINKINKQKRLHHRRRRLQCKSCETPIDGILGTNGEITINTCKECHNTESL